ncbi:hypothetical protein AVEN_126760-1 [Araneus ventricosus]|uniref:Uncharacterized protein n=1 Tax=Araneus ventricosus TaxID=182803 RepID=A0A4Y2HZY8_ARAVE|nr:hypothetical protein AVEN_126760-1 [Araneus ventricosus]
MDTEVATTVLDNAGDLCPEMDAQKLSESLKDIAAKVTALKLSDSDSSKSADVRQILFKTFIGMKKNLCKRKQQTNPSWRRSGRRWQPTSVFKRDKTPPRRRPPSSTDTDSCDRPAIRGRPRVKSPPRRRPPSSTDTDSCERPAVRGRSRVREITKTIKFKRISQGFQCAQ